MRLSEWKGEVCVVGGWWRMCGVEDVWGGGGGECLGGGVGECVRWRRWRMREV